MGAIRHATIQVVPEQGRDQVRKLMLFSAFVCFDPVHLKPRHEDKIGSLFLVLGNLILGRLADCLIVTK